MTKDVIPGPGLMGGVGLGGPGILDPLGFGAPALPIPVTEPGDVADPSGDLWLDAFGDRLVHGEMSVTPAQAEAGAKHGWEIIPGSATDGTVTVRRPDPNPSDTG